MKLLVFLGLAMVVGAQGHWHKECTLPCPEGQKCREIEGVPQCVERHRGWWRRHREEMQGMMSGSGEGEVSGSGHDDDDDDDMKRRHRHHHRHEGMKDGDDDDDDDDAGDDEEMLEIAGGIGLGVALLALGFGLGVTWVKYQMRKPSVVYAGIATFDSTHVPINEGDDLELISVKQTEKVEIPDN
eukprot:TRINITY_DN3545_c0_g1_i1.p1 TRINITY_DN3545_c0_g1~~TRINITY_DN3545_c0_g1_i1.p1  ORF type:complete len:185 (+),score=57.11 TRINITY_DN3545_c0_g1_i1:68-622(+)